MLSSLRLDLLVINILKVMMVLLVMLLVRLGLKNMVGLEVDIKKIVLILISFFVPEIGV